MVKMYLSMEFNFFWKNLQSYNFEWKIARNRSRVDEKAKRKNVREKIAHDHAYACLLKEKRPIQRYLI